MATDGFFYNSGQIDDYQLQFYPRYLEKGMQIASSLIKRIGNIFAPTQLLDRFFTFQNVFMLLTACTIIFDHLFARKTAHARRQAPT